MCVCVGGGGGCQREHGSCMAVIHCDSSAWHVRTAGQTGKAAALIFICSTVCFAFKSLAEREALDTPWMAQDPFHFLKTRDSFSKLRGIQDRERRCLKGTVLQLNRAQGFPATQISSQSRGRRKRGECSVITHNQANGGWCECGWGGGKGKIQSPFRWTLKIKPGGGQAGCVEQKTNMDGTSPSNARPRLLTCRIHFARQGCQKTVTSYTWERNQLDIINTIPQADVMHWQGGIPLFKQWIYIYLPQHLYCTFLSRAGSWTNSYCRAWY